MERGNWCVLYSAFIVTHSVKASSGSSVDLSLYIDLEQIMFSLNFMFCKITYYLTNPIVEICIHKKLNGVDTLGFCLFSIFVFFVNKLKCS